MARLFAEHPIDLGLANSPEPGARAVRPELAVLDPFADRWLGHAQKLCNVCDAEQWVLFVCQYPQIGID